MARGWVHTVHRDGKVVEGQAAIRGAFERKSEAAAAGRERARRWTAAARVRSRA
jgi:hypothetical protein